MKKVVSRLARAMCERNITQAELARRTGVRPNTVNDWYHGFIDHINISHLARFCEVLDCEIGGILRLEGENHV